MLLTPPNYIFSMQLVPIYEWEPAETADGRSPAASPPTPCQGTDVPMSASDEPSSPTDWRLVFKGYEWRSVGERAVFVREDWESTYRPEADEGEKERDPVAHRSEPARRPVPAQPHLNHVSDGIHPSDPEPKDD